MNQQELGQRIRTICRQLCAEKPSLRTGHNPTGAKAMAVYNHCTRNEPTIMRHMSRYYSGQDPYQVFKRWV